MADVEWRFVCVFHVKHIDKQRFGEGLCLVQLLHLLLNHYCLLRYLLARSMHHQQPRKILKEQCLHPRRHGVGLLVPVVVVQDHDGGDHTARHHEHDAVEVCS